MADPKQKPLLKKNGKLVKKDGKLVRSDDPDNCECCGCPDCCRICFAPAVLPRIIATRVRVTATDAILEWDNDYPAPQLCNNRYEFVFRVRGKSGAILTIMHRASVIGVTTYEFAQKLADICNGGDQPASVEVVLTDPNGNCFESPANSEAGPDYSNVCPQDCNNDLMCPSLCCGTDLKCHEMIAATKFPFADACPPGWSYAGTVVEEPGFEYCCPPGTSARPVGKCCPNAARANPLP